MTRDSDTVFFKERHLVPALVVQSGLAKFNLMLEMNAPGTVPDPLLIAALIDLVSKVENILKGSLDSILSLVGCCQQTFENKKFVDITQQCFALLPYEKFPANDLNFH